MQARHAQVSFLSLSFSHCLHTNPGKFTFYLISQGMFSVAGLQRTLIYIQHLRIFLLCLKSFEGCYGLQAIIKTPQSGKEGFPFLAPPFSIQPHQFLSHIPLISANKITTSVTHHIVSHFSEKQFVSFHFIDLLIITCSLMLGLGFIIFKKILLTSFLFPGLVRCPLPELRPESITQSMPREQKTMMDKGGDSGIRLLGFQSHCCLFTT